MGTGVAPLLQRLQPLLAAVLDASKTPDPQVVQRTGGVLLEVLGTCTHARPGRQPLPHPSSSSNMWHWLLHVPPFLPLMTQCHNPMPCPAVKAREVGSVLRATGTLLERFQGAFAGPSRLAACSHLIHLLQQPTELPG
jgi:hypothetical protein